MGVEEKKEWLRRYCANALEIERLRDEMARWRSLAEYGGSGFFVTGSSGSGGGHHDRMADAVERVMLLEDELATQICLRVKRRREIERAVERVADEGLQVVLRMRYLDGMNFEHITEADFVGANEVRINKMTGFCASDYERGGENARAKINVTKETRKLAFERWMGYDLDALDASENAGLDVTAVVEEHTRLVAIPEKDRVAVQRLLENSSKLVQETITSANALAAFDTAEQYMVDAEIGGPYGGRYNILADDAEKLSDCLYHSFLSFHTTQCRWCGR